jgi:hypothetical protein
MLHPPVGSHKVLFIVGVVDILGIVDIVGIVGIMGMMTITGVTGMTVGIRSTSIMRQVLKVLERMSTRFEDEHW